MTWKYGKRSLAHLEECHADLAKLALRALSLSPFDLAITDGGRTLAEQREMVAAGKSRTLKSRHRFAYPVDAAGRRRSTRDGPVSHALDFMVYVAGRASWEFPLYERVWLEAWKPAAAELAVQVTWGGSWARFKDGPHIQLAWSAYPAVYAEDA